MRWCCFHWCELCALTLMHDGSCDSLNVDGTKKPLSQERGTYGHAQKMRASMTYAFGKLNGLGNMPWHESDAGDGIMFGNPSISVEVSSFMCSLRRRKVIFSLGAHICCFTTDRSAVLGPSRGGRKQCTCNNTGESNVSQSLTRC
jgi:hypothetical protein